MSDLSELFARNPEHYSDQDISVIVARMRKSNTQYELGVKAPVVAKKPPKSAKTLDLLKDLGLT